MGRGFAFSFDAFVAFMLAMVVIATLFAFVNKPYGYYDEYRQMYLIGRDTIETMSRAEYSANRTYMEEFASQLDSSPEEACNLVRNFIPVQYAFRIEEYNNDTDSWDLVCEKKRLEGSEHTHLGCDDFAKLKVTLPFIVVEDSVPPSTDQQYGYNGCTGEWTPCATPESVFEPGSLENRLLRLVICV